MQALRVGSGSHVNVGLQLCTMEKLLVDIGPEISILCDNVTPRHYDDLPNNARSLPQKV